MNILAAMLLLSACVQARTLNVATGGTYDTIGKALDAAEAGDEIVLSEVGKLGLEVKKVPGGIEIVKVLAGGGGEAAGLKAGDNIVEVEGQATRSMELPYAVSRLGGAPGSTIRITYQKAGEKKDRRAEVTRMPLRYQITGDARSKLQVALDASDVAAIVAQARALAKNDDPHGQLYLARAYAYGAGVGKDPELAKRWAKPCAQSGLASCQRLYGVLLGSGDIDTRDLRGAASWLTKAAEQGDAPAALELGHAYAKGKGVPADPLQAQFWYKKAADGGVAEARELVK